MKKIERSIKINGSKKTTKSSIIVSEEKVKDFIKEDIEKLYSSASRQIGLCALKQNDADALSFTIEPCLMFYNNIQISYCVR